MASWELASARIRSIGSHFYEGDLAAIRRPELVDEAVGRGDVYAATCLRLGVCNSAWLVDDQRTEAEGQLRLASESWHFEGCTFRSVGTSRRNHARVDRDAAQCAAQFARCLLELSKRKSRYPCGTRPKAQSRRAAHRVHEGRAMARAPRTGARQKLRDTVRKIVHAQSPPEALGSRRGLAPAWTVVIDTIESDGRRYIVAREEHPTVSGPSSLTPTERRVVTMASRNLTTKEVAYTLGMSDTTVRVLIMRACRRCGARNRQELFRMIRDSLDREHSVMT